MMDEVKEEKHKYLRYPNYPNTKEKVPDYRDTDQYKYDILTYSTCPKKYSKDIKFFGQSAQYYKESHLKQQFKLPSISQQLGSRLLKNKRNVNSSQSNY